MPRRKLTARERAEADDRNRLNTRERMRQLRQSQEYRNNEHERNTSAHQEARRDLEYRQHEQEINTVAHRRKRSSPTADFKIALDFNGQIEPNYLGKMEEECSECSALLFSCERRGVGDGFSLCCSHGKVKLPSIRTSNVLLDLLHNNKNYLTHIRSYNSAMAMASTIAKVEEPRPFGPRYFKVHDQIYHSVGSLYAQDGDRPVYAQLYTYDVKAAAQERMGNPANEGCDLHIMETLSQHLAEINPYAQSFKKMHDLIQESPEDAESVTMEIISTKEHDTRRYNTPTALSANDVATIFRAEDGQPIGERRLVVHPFNSQLKSINIMDPSLDPLAYPLLFPYGEPGWHINLKHDPLHSTAKRSNVTLMEYSKYRLAHRPQSRFIQSNGALFLQWVTDLYSRMEENNLNFQRMNQNKLRMELKQNLMDHLIHQADQSNMIIGKPILLASTFKGSPRNMLELYNDAMAIVREYGKPDIFITMTCNPEWTEIIESLPDGCKWNDCPDIVDRVFHEKVQELLKDIEKHSVFGKATALIYTIEFQKRGLPHIHILVSLENDYKIYTSEHVDKVVSAEIPSEVDAPILRKIILKHNIHGPCDQSDFAPCHNDKGICKKNFPKPFSNKTRDCNKGFPTYRRRDNVTQIRKKGKIIDNSWVVPYSPYLSQKYNSHINVEVCASVQAVKYLYKYIFKGFDACVVVFKNQQVQNELVYDEIKSYLNARYVTSHEACWRLFGFEMSYMTHTVMRMACHLENHEPVLFKEGNEVAAANADHRTTLTEWFKANQVPDSPSKHLLYTEMPQNYTWNQKEWRVRKRGGDKVVTRMYIVSPKNIELFHLRLLLLHVRGATSYTDLKTVNGLTYPTFRDAAIKLGIAESNDAYVNAIQEAVDIKTSAKHLRDLFAITIALNAPEYARELWDMFKDRMCDDLKNTMPLDEAYNRALIHVDEILTTHGTSCQELNLPLPVFDLTSVEQDDDDLMDNQFDDLYLKANEDQKKIIDEVCNCIQQNIPRLFMVDAPGGCGKTFTELALIAWCKLNRVGFLPTAHSGVAASLLPHGRTMHSQYKLPINMTETSRSDVKFGSALAVKLQKARLLIFDECSTIPRYSITVIDRLLKDLDTSTNNTFAGKVVVFCGDFRQTLPVVPHGGRAESVDICIKSSALWQNVTFCKLHKNMRVDNGEEEFSEFLISVGNGTLPIVSGEDFVMLPSRLTGEGSPIDFVYDRHTLATCEDITERAILAPTNEDCDLINNEVMELLPGEEKVYLSFDKEISDGTEQLKYPTEFLNTLQISGLPRYKLVLKKGALVMLIRNLDASRGLINGTRLRVEIMHQNLIDCTILTGASAGERVLIPRIKLSPSDSSIPISFSRTQFPLILAFSLTINKSQGQSLSRIALFLRRPVFSHGQLYVALSRCRSFSGVKVFAHSIEGQSITADGEIITRNVVFREIL